MQEELLDFKRACFETLTKANPTIDDFKRLHSFKHNFIPNSLYKYYSLPLDKEELILNTLSTDQVWLNNPSNFNDPYDSNLSLNINLLTNFWGLDSQMLDNPALDSFITKEEKEKLKKSENICKDLASIAVKKSSFQGDKKRLEADILKIMEGRERSILEDMQKGLKKHLRISCFSEKYNSLVMWAHYAQNHKGFCIEYDFKKLEKDDPRLIFLYPVIYTDELLDLTKTITDSNQTHTFSSLLASMYKSIEWSIEKEWRLIAPLENIEYYSIPAKKIILGSKISNQHKERLVAISAEKNIPLYQISIKPNSFNLYASEIST